MTLILIKEVTIKGSFRYGVSCLHAYQRSVDFYPILSPAITPLRSPSLPKEELI